jgi:hypothetical protein
MVASTLATSASRCGIKRDPSLFPLLEEEKINDVWHCSFSNQAHLQDVMQVLDPANVPAASTEESELFSEKQKDVYAILEQKVLTGRGKTIVHKPAENDFFCRESVS